jgi:prephenate dehydratase
MSAQISGASKLRLGYLGPEGTFSEQAAIGYNQDAEYVRYSSIPQVASAVESGEIDEGVVPIENSLHGSIIDILDFLIRTDNTFIKHELAIPVEQCLMLAPDRKSDEVEVVYSHPQALGQCRGYLAEHYPNARMVASLSTAGSVSDMLASTSPAAAIAPFRAGEIHCAFVATRGIQDNTTNYTRFVVLAGEDAPPSGRDKTSLAFWFPSDAPGSLYTALGVFANRGLNLTKIESRPTGQSLGEYLFLVDVEGHRTDEKVGLAFDDLAAHTTSVKVFGSYPMMERLPD